MVLWLEMRLRFTIVCDNAFTDKEGRLNIIQTYDVIETSKFPARHLRLTIVSNYEFEENDPRKKDYSQTIKIVQDKTGNEIIKGTMDLKIKERGGNYIQFINNIIALQFNDEGVYNVDLELNGEQFPKAASFVVKKTTN